jgi:hypothetical protein
VVSDDLQLKRQTLEATSFGARVAEEEVDDLAEYFVETDHEDVPDGVELGWRSGIGDYAVATIAAPSV